MVNLVAPLGTQKFFWNDIEGWIFSKQWTKWWFQTIFYVQPYLGKISILTYIFQIGWFNHQLDEWIH